MAETEEVILEKPEDEKKLDESLKDYKGQAGEAPQDEEFATLPDELPSDGGEVFSFTRESAPKESEATFEKKEEEDSNELIPWYKDRKFLYLVGASLFVTSALIFILMILTFKGDNVKPDIIATKL